MPLSNEISHLDSIDHIQRTKQLHVWCEDCCNEVSDKTGHFQSEIHLQKNQQRSFSQDTRSGMQSRYKNLGQTFIFISQNLLYLILKHGKKISQYLNKK